jgi:hypothetical protein
MLISKLHMYLPCKRGQIRSGIWNDLEGGVRVRDTSIRIYSTLKSDSGKSFVLIKPWAVDLPVLIIIGSLQLGPEQVQPLGELFLLPEDGLQLPLKLGSIPTHTILC